MPEVVERPQMHAAEKATGCVLGSTYAGGLELDCDSGLKRPYS